MNLNEYKGPKGLQDDTFTIAAGARHNFTGVGKLFQVITSDGVLSIKTDVTAEADFVARQGVMADDSALFERLEIVNRTGLSITARVIYGFGQFIDGQSEIIGSVEVTSSTLPTGAATSAKQDTLIAKDFATQTTLAAVLAKIIAAPATSAKQDDIITWLQSIDTAVSDVATQTTLAAILAKIIAAPSTEAKQDTGNTSLASILAALILPAALDADGRLKVGKQIVGAQGNAWNAAATGAGGFSTAIDTKDAESVSSFGVTDGATTITVQVSQDNATFYDTTNTAVLVGAGDFHIYMETGAKYVRLKSSANVTATATISAKS